MTAIRPSLEIISPPAISRRMMNGLPDFVPFSEQQANEDRAKALFGLMVRAQPNLTTPRGSNRLFEAVYSEVILPNEARRESHRERGLKYRNPLTDFVLKGAIELPFYGQKPSPELWEAIQRGLDPWRALERKKYRFTAGAEVHVTESPRGLHGVIVSGLGPEKQRTLTCVFAEQPMTDARFVEGLDISPTMTLKLQKPQGFNPGAAAANPGASRGATPSLGSRE